MDYENRVEEIVLTAARQLGQQIRVFFVLPTVGGWEVSVSDALQIDSFRLHLDRGSDEQILQQAKRYLQNRRLRALARSVSECG